MVLPVLCQVHELLARFLRHGARRPDLAVGVRVRAAHRRSLVLEDLHVSQLLLRYIDLAIRVDRYRLQRLRSLGCQGMSRRHVLGVDARPGLDHGQDLGRGHVGEGDIVLCRERKDIALAGDSSGLEEEGGGIVARGLGLVVLLLRLHRAVVVDEGEGGFVLGVRIALCALVPGAEVAL